MQEIDAQMAEQEAKMRAKYGDALPSAPGGARRAMLAKKVQPPPVVLSATWHKCLRSIIVHQTSCCAPPDISSSHSFRLSCSETRQNPACQNQKPDRMLPV